MAERRKVVIIPRKDRPRGSISSGNSVGGMKRGRVEDDFVVEASRARKKRRMADAHEGAKKKRVYKSKPYYSEKGIADSECAAKGKGVMNKNGKYYCRKGRPKIGTYKKHTPGPVETGKTKKGNAVYTSARGAQFVLRTKADGTTYRAYLKKRTQ